MLKQRSLYSLCCAVISHSGAKLCPILCNLWTVAHQGSLPTEFSRQEFWSRLPFPAPEDLPTQRSNPDLPHCRQILYYLSHL